MTAVPMTQPKNRDHVDLTHEGEVVWWCAHLSVTPTKLREAVEKVGPSADEIRKHLHDAARLSFSGGGED